MKRRIKNSDIPCDFEVRETLSAWIDNEYNKQPYGGSEHCFKGMSRLDVWNATITERRESTPDKLNLLMMRSTRPQKIKRNGVYVKIAGEPVWFIHEEQTINNLEKEVFVRYDPADLRTIRIYDAEDDSFLFEWQNASSLMVDFITEVQEDIADAQEKVRSAKKFIKKQAKAIEDNLSQEQRISMLDMVIKSAQKNTEELEIRKPKRIIPLIVNEESSLRKALSGENEADAVEIENFFTAREYAFSIYTEEQCDIIRQFEKRILAVGSAGKALENSGISAGTMSNLRKGTYKGIVDKMFSKISSFLELKDENSKVYKHSGYVPTSISESIYENIRTAHISGVCVMVTGDAGIGKTEAAKHYQAEHPDNSVIITAIEPKTTKAAMLEILAAKLGIDLSETKRAMYSQKILSELHDGTVIIVDEAQNFNFTAIDTLRGFADYFRNENLGTVGIVCMGNDTFRQQFFGKSGSIRITLITIKW